MNGSTMLQFEETLKEQAGELKDLVDAGDISGALGVITQLNETRDVTLFNEVGKLTRTLHESIRNFNIDATDRIGAQDLSEINDASDRLAYVVKKTDEAANKTMDLVEATMPMAADIRVQAAQMSGDWAKLKRKEMSAEEFRGLSQRMEQFLTQLSESTDKVHNNLSEILLAQDFQDLTGQVINRVTTLIKDVEENLVDLVAMAGKVDRITGTVHDSEVQQLDISAGEGPQIHADKRDDVVSGQDDVDDLLSSLGF